MKWVLTIPEIEILPRESSSTIIAYVVRSRPIPPYSSGMVTPNRPSSFICSTTGSGNLSSWSYSSAIGMTSLSTNCRTISVIARCSSVFSPYGLVASAMVPAGYRRPRLPSPSSAPRLVPARVARHERRRAPERPAPARAGAPGGVRVVHARVEPQPGDHDVCVAGVRIDRDPPARAAASPAHEAARVEGQAQEPAAVEGVAHGARAVVAGVDPADARAVATPVAVRLLDQGGGPGGSHTGAPRGPGPGR